MAAQHEATRHRTALTASRQLPRRWGLLAQLAHAGAQLQVPFGGDGHAVEAVVAQADGGRLCTGHQLEIILQLAAAGLLMPAHVDARVGFVVAHAGVERHFRGPLGGVFAQKVIVKCLLALFTHQGRDRGGPHHRHAEGVASYRGLGGLHLQTVRRRSEQTVSKAVVFEE